MKAETVKRLAILIAVLSVVGGTGYFAHGYQLDRNARSRIKKAELAAKEGDFAKAERLYREHLEVFPEDVDVNIKYAGALLKVDRSPERQNVAIGIYSDIVRRNSGREDVRRQLMQLMIDTRHFNDAALQLEILLKTSREDGTLHFLRGRCYEEAGDDEKAAPEYEKAITFNAGCDLRLMSSVKDVSEIPTGGEDLIIVAAVDHVLHFRMFDGDGKVVVDTDEKRLTGQAPQIEDLRKQLVGLWPPHELTGSQKGRVITAVTSIVGHTHNAPQRIEAYQRCARLNRDKLNEPKKAEEAIKTMVQSEPENYQVYLARGRYRLEGAKADVDKALQAVAKDDSQKGLNLAPGEPETYLGMAEYARAAANNDFEKALQLAPGKPEVYLAMAENVAKDQSGRDKARQILEEGLKKAPTSMQLYGTLANLELRAGEVDRAIKTLEDGVKLVSEPGRLREFLAEHILAARGDARRGDTDKLLRQIEELRKIGYPSVYLQYLTARYCFNTKDFLKARQLLLPLQGRRELQPVYKEQVNLLLADCYGQLGEVERQKETRRRVFSADPENLTAKLDTIDDLINRGKTEEAIKECQALITRAPHIRLPLARLLIARNQRRPESQRNWNEVKSVIDDAAKAAPESVEPVVLLAQLRRVQGNLTAARDELEKARSRFPKSGRLWIEQADIARFQERFDEASRLLDQAKEQLGDRVTLRLARAQLLMTKRGPQVVKELNDLAQNIHFDFLIKGIEFHFDLFSKEDRRRLLSGLASDLDRQQDLEGARGLWSQLAEENPNNLELRLALLDLAFRIENKDEVAKRNEIEKNINEIERIEGSKGLEGRLSQVRYLIWQARQRCDLRLMSSVNDVSDIPKEGKNLIIVAAVDNVLHFRMFDGDGKVVVDTDEKRLTEQARQIEDLRKQLVGLWPPHQLTGSEQDRVITGVTSTVGHTPGQGSDKNKQRELRNLAHSLLNELRSRRADWYLIPLTQAQLEEQELVQGGLNKEEREAKKESIVSAYRQAIELSRRNLAVVRLALQFLLKNGRGNDARELLNSLPAESWLFGDLYLSRPGAQYAVENRDFQRAEEIVRNAVAANPGDFEDLRILARVLERQKTPQHRKRAIEILKSLADQKVANSDDQFLLAELYDVSGDWPEARKRYRELNLGTKNPRDMVARNRRLIYLAQYANSLLQHLRPGEEQELTEAQELVNELKQLQPNALSALFLQAEINLTRNQPDSAAKLLDEYAKGPNLPPEVLEALANLAEKLYHQLGPAASRGRLGLAAFLGRRGHLKEVLDICEPLWTSRGEVDEGVVDVCFDVVTSGKGEPNRAQLDRVSGWLERALAQSQNERLKPLLLFDLANIRDRQELYQKAEDLYQSVVKLGNHNGVAPSTKLIATSYNNLAWLMALKDGKKDGKGREALDHIKRAITLVGPHPDFLDTRGVVYLTADLAADNSQHAIDDLEKAVASDPAPSKLFHLAQAYLQANNKEKAKQYFDAAKAKGLPSGLHALEQPAYQKVLSELGAL